MVTFATWAMPETTWETRSMMGQLKWERTSWHGALRPAGQKKTVKTCMDAKTPEIGKNPYRKGERGLNSCDFLYTFFWVSMGEPDSLGGAN